MPKPALPPYYLGGTRDDDELDARGFNEDYTVDGRAGRDTIYGGNGHDTLLGGGGNDLIYASLEDSVVDGGAGIDTASFFYSNVGVNARLVGGMLGPASDILDYRNVMLNVENLVGSAYDDQLAGNGYVNELDGGAGNDWLLPWGSGDFLTGGSGGDQFELGFFGGRRTSVVTITDFDYGDGDRIHFDLAPDVSWAVGTGKDADGNLHEAWIGTAHTAQGATIKIVVLGADSAPSDGWIITGG